ncbi:MAG TPA: hypothetical protein VHY19_15920 [Steroidobacteraceae bacterium]|jgi:hypothetical protein|nr:hypothetical protein [Steroidobacteraceae bacterium]
MADDPSIDFGNERDGQLAGLPECIYDQMLPVIAVGGGCECVDRDGFDIRSIPR